MMTAASITAAARREIERLEPFVREQADALAVPRVSGEFLHALVLAGGFRHGLELGTSYGYSGLWIASALAHNGGSLITIDHSRAKAEAALSVFQRAGLSGAVRTMCGEIREALANLAGTFDFIFIDADKPPAVEYFEAIWPHLWPRAAIVTDNITTHPQELAPFIAHVRARAGCYSTLVPIGSGLEVTVKVER